MAKKIDLMGFKKLYVTFTFLFTLSFLCAQNEDVNLSITHYNFLPSQAKVNSILLGENNVKYIATSAGLFAVKDQNTAGEKLYNMACLDVIQSTDESLFVLTENEIINLGTDYKTQLPEETVANSFNYNRSIISVASDKGVLRYNTKTSKWLSSYNRRNSKLPDDNITFIFTDKNRKTWIGTKGGIAIIDLDDQWKVYERNHSMEAMAYNSEGIWLLSDKEMWLIDDFGRWYPAALNRGLKQGEVKDITTDQDGRLILASETITRYNPYDETMYSFSESLGFLSKKTSTIQGDLNKDIWIGTEDEGVYIIGFSDTKTVQMSAVFEIENAISCDNSNSGEISVKTFGGVPPYNYKWQHTNTNKNQLSNLSAGAYQLTITDSANNELELTYDFKTKYPITIKTVSTTPATNPYTEDGFAEIKIIGGQQPYTISWKNGQSDLINSSLKYGANSITITDANGCVVEEEIEIQAGKFIPALNIETIELGQILQMNELSFNADSSEVTKKSLGVLDEVYEFLIQNPTVSIEIGGHTNNIPPKEYCYRLSSERAENVANYLVSKGIKNNRLSYIGYGKDYPIATNETLAGRKKNQRVEIMIVKINQ